MLILYTTVEGGYWIPFNTPMLEPELLARIEDVFVYHAEVDPEKCQLRKSVDIAQYGDHICRRGCQYDSTIRSLFVPQDDSLPEFHSILTRNNWRWDAQNQEWFGFACIDVFLEWFDSYVAQWRPFEDDDEREFAWKDQMHPGEDLREMIERSR